MKTAILLAIAILFFSGHSFAQLFRPYKCGPVLKRDMIQMFDTLNRYLDIRGGTTFAEIGASSGYYNGAMAVYLDSVTFYLQDIDESCLNEENLRKLLKYYSQFRNTPITQTNDFHIVIGTATETNLPEDSIDVIYSNATYHVLDHPDSILSDLFRSLKKDGTLSVRDQFSYDGKERYCEDKKCGQPLVQYDDFINTMKRNGFALVDKNDHFGYPIYKFKKASGQE